jgi:hypothetical protein
MGHEWLGDFFLLDDSVKFDILGVETWVET